MTTQSPFNILSETLAENHSQEYVLNQAKELAILNKNSQSNLFEIAKFFAYWQSKLTAKQAKEQRNILVQLAGVQTYSTLTIITIIAEQ